MSPTETAGYAAFAAAWNEGQPLAPLLASNPAALVAAGETFLRLDARNGGMVNWNSASGGLLDLNATLAAMGVADRPYFLATALESARAALPGVRLSVGGTRMTWDQYAEAMAANFDKPVAQEMLTLDVLDADDYARQFLAKSGGLERAASLLKTLVELRADCDKIKPEDPDKARLFAQARADFVRAEARLRAALTEYYRNPPPPAAEAPPATQAIVQPQFHIEVAAPVVNLEAQIPAAQQVEIVSMPTRETVTDVRRDRSGKITESTQIERDVEAA